MSTPTLFGIHYSPWSLRARWALDHHGVDYRYREHTPLLGEWGLRFRSRKRVGSGPVTVPLLVLPERAIDDSFEIMCFADEVGEGEPLRASYPDVAMFINGLESAYDAARRRVRGAYGDTCEWLGLAQAAAPRGSTPGGDRIACGAGGG